MAQTQTLKYASNIKTAEQKFAQKADSLNMKIFKAVSVIKQKVSKWTSKSSSRSSSLGGTIAIREARVRDLAKYGSSIVNSRLLLSI